MKEITKFVAFDGAEYLTKAECAAHEREQAHERLIGLTEEQVLAALSYADPELADAIEFVGNKISAARRAKGAFRRAPKGAAAVTPEGKPTEAAIIAAGGTPGEPPPKPYYQPPVSEAEPDFSEVPDGAPLDDGEEF